MVNSLKITLIPGRDARLPERKTGSVGYDIFLPGKDTEYRLEPGWGHRIGLGIIVQPPEDYYVELVARSSITNYPGLFVQNCVGIIDPSYCGPDDELTVVLFNASSSVYSMKAGHRICQLLIRQQIIYPVEEIPYDAVQTKHSRGGLGSTGQ